MLKRTLAAKKDSSALFAVQGAETAISTVTARQYVTRIFFFSIVGTLTMQQAETPARISLSNYLIPTLVLFYALIHH